MGEVTHATTGRYFRRDAREGYARRLKALKSYKPEPRIKIRRSHRACEPCGNCRACLADKKARRDAAAFRKELRSMLKLLWDARSAIHDELNSADVDEKGKYEHPIIEAHARVMERLDNKHDRIKALLAGQPPAGRKVRPSAVP